MDLSIAIVSYNTKEVLLDCVYSVHAHTIGITFEVIVVDNDSRDEIGRASCRERV